MKNLKRKYNNNILNVFFKKKVQKKTNYKKVQKHVLPPLPPKK